MINACCVRRSLGRANFLLNLIKIVDVRLFDTPTSDLNELLSDTESEPVVPRAHMLLALYSDDISGSTLWCNELLYGSWIGTSSVAVAATSLSLEIEIWTSVAPSGFDIFDTRLMIQCWLCLSQKCIISLSILRMLGESDARPFPFWIKALCARMWIMAGSATYVIERIKQFEMTVGRIQWGCRTCAEWVEWHSY